MSDEGVEDGDVDGADGGALVAALSSAEVDDLVLESLDVGILLSNLDGQILRVNHLARHFIAAFGKEAESVPATLWTNLQSIVDSSKAVPGRFTPASPMTAPDKRRFFVRCRRLRDTVLITIAPAALREIDVHRVLAEQFGLSAQEIKIAFFAAQGYRNREIAERLDIVEGTVKNYLTAVFAALSVRSRTELASELAQLVEEQTDVHRRGG